MGDLIGFELPKIDGIPCPNLAQRLKRFKQKCELLFDGPLKPRSDEQKCKYSFLWTGDYGLDLYNTWNLSEEQQKSLEKYWKRLEEHVKPQSNYILNHFYYLRSLKQNNRPLEEFLTEAKLLIQNSGYSTDMHDKLLRDALVFGVDSDIVRKKGIAEGNKLTLQKAREIARTEEATKMQLEAMANHSQINLLNKKDFSKGKTQPRNKPSKGEKGKEHKQTDKPKPECERCGGRPHDKLQKRPAINLKCYNCHKVGHYQHMCFKTKPSGVNTLQGESSDPGESDLQ